jgi:hypothetical protein
MLAKARVRRSDGGGKLRPIMTKESIAQALEAEGLTGGNQGYTIPENREAVGLIGTPGEIFSVDRLVKLELRDKHLVLENSKRERFVFGYEHVLGFRLLAAPAARDRVAGFTR